jgi:hypothetical protein
MIVQFNYIISGFQLSTDVLSILILRYMRKDGTLRFGDFVSAILHLSVAFSKSHVIQFHKVVSNCITMNSYALNLIKY